MDSKSAIDQNGFIYQIKTSFLDFWSNLSESKQEILKRIWSILTYKWKWQIALNAPFLVIWVLDQTIPAFHSFDVKLISLLPIPTVLKTLIGLS
tara:strand:- start:146 stop:427 length:282 start_codon:yes stop_codon:yes gene_type:complete